MMSSHQASAKRKDPPPSVEIASTEDVKKPPTVKPIASSSSSPYETKLESLQEYRQAAGDKHILWNIFSENLLERIPGKLDELDVEDAEELTNDELKAAYQSLTAAQVEEHLHYLIVPSDFADLEERFCNDITFADPRNDRNYDIVMLDTWSSSFMCRVIHKQLDAATRAINEAKKAVRQGSTTPNIAQKAFKKTIAAVIACDGQDHWRIDTEIPEECEKIAKKVSKLCKELLWFKDGELGLVDPFSRRTLIARFKHMQKEWSQVDYMDCTIPSFQTDQNGMGLGRSDDLAPPLPAKKKARTTTATFSSGTDHTIVKHLTSIQDKLPLRVQTQVQLSITAEKSPQSARVVVSGATNLKKLGQLCAYLTGHHIGFQHHPQKGKSLKGSRFELRLVDSVLWVGENRLAKEAAAADAAHALDKTVKIVQVFQGLITGAQKGMVYDSDTARTLATTPGSLIWISNDGTRYSVSAEGIMANKCLRFGKQTLPRLVTDDNDNLDATTGFGQRIHATNAYLRGERQGPSFLCFDDEPEEEIQKALVSVAAAPICDEKGTCPFFDKSTASYFFKTENVNAAGPPSPF